MTNVCQEILTQYPYRMDQECIDALAAYVRGKYHTITKKLADTMALRNNDEAIADATAALERKTSEYSTGLSQLQAIINHEMLLAIAMLLPLAKHGGLVKPKLERAFTLHNQQERLKERHLRKPYNAIAAISMLNEECTGESTAMQGVARINVLQHIRPDKMDMYEWSISFEAPLKHLTLAGYDMQAKDDKELYKDVFAAQLTQSEINLLHG